MGSELVLRGTHYCSSSKNRVPRCALDSCIHEAFASVSCPYLFGKKTSTAGERTGEGTAKDRMDE
jgi:hypothetical protein